MCRRKGPSIFSVLRNSSSPFSRLNLLLTLPPVLAKARLSCIMLERSFCPLRVLLSVNRSLSLSLSEETFMLLRVVVKSSGVRRGLPKPVWLSNEDNLLVSCLGLTWECGWWGKKDLSMDGEKAIEMMMAFVIKHSRPLCFSITLHQWFPFGRCAKRARNSLRPAEVRRSSLVAAC